MNLDEKRFMGFNGASAVYTAEALYVCMSIIRNTAKDFTPMGEILCRISD